MASLASNFEHSRSSRSAGKPRTQNLRSVRTAVTLMPRSAIAASALCATGSITPGFGSTWITVHRPPGAARPAARISDLADDRSFDDRVAQQFAGDALDVRAGELSFDQVSVRDGGVQRIGQVPVRPLRPPGAQPPGRAGRRPDRCQLPTASRSPFRVSKYIGQGPSHRRFLAPGETWPVRRSKRSKAASTLARFDNRISRHSSASPAAIRVVSIQPPATSGRLSRGVAETKAAATKCGKWLAPATSCHVLRGSFVTPWLPEIAKRP